DGAAVAGLDIDAGVGGAEMPRDGSRRGEDTSLQRGERGRSRDPVLREVRLRLGPLHRFRGLPAVLAVDHAGEKALRVQLELELTDIPASRARRPRSAAECGRSD